MRRLRTLLGGLWGSLLLIGCAVEPVASRGQPLADDPRAVSTVERVQQRFPKARAWFRQVSGMRLYADGSHLVPDWGSITHARVLREDPAGQRLRPRLPRRADGAVEVALDGQADLWVRATPLSILPVAAEVADGVIVYRGAYGHADLFYKLTPTHVDEYVYLPDPSAPHRFRFRLEAGPGVGEIRFTGDVVEVFDRDGTARLRLGKPFLRAADGARRDGTLRLDGDLLTLEVDTTGLAFPVLVDPDWTTTGRLLQERFVFQVYLLQNGEVLAPAGCTLTACPPGLGMPSCSPVLPTVELYNPQSRTWRSATSMAQPRFAYAGERLPSGEVLVAGGCTGRDCAGTTDTSEIYDPTHDAWVRGPTLSQPRAYLTATPLPGGDLLFVGGCDAGVGCSGVVEIYDVARRELRRAADLLRPRGLHVAVALADGRVLVVGGCTTLACTGVLPSAEIYDPVANRWSSAGAMASPRAGHTATRVGDGTVVVVGGCANAACKPTLATVERFSPRLGQWFPVRDLPSPRHDHSAALLRDGTLLLAGGCFGTNPGSCTDETLIYDPDLSTFSPSGRINVARAYAATLTLSDGEILFTGGCNYITCLPWGETYPIPMKRPDAGAPWMPEPPPDGYMPAKEPPPPDLAPPYRPPGPGWEAEGCGCRLGRPGGSLGAPLVVALVGLWIRRRRRSRGDQPSSSASSNTAAIPRINPVQE